jgi:hypothetical protein
MGPAQMQVQTQDVTEAGATGAGVVVDREHLGGVVLAAPEGP